MIPAIPFDPQRLVASIKGYIDATGISGYVHDAAGAVLVALSLLMILRAIVWGDGRGIFEALLRMVLAAWAVSSAPALSAHAARMFAGFSNAGFQVLGNIVNRAQIQELLGAFALSAAEINLALIGGQTATGAFGNLPLASTLAKVADTIGAMTRTGLLIVGIGMALLFATYYLMSFWARMILMVSSLLAPLSFACLAHPRTDHFAWLWVRTVIKACLVIFLANLVLSGAVYLGILRPLEEIRNAPLLERFALIALPISALAALGFGILALGRIDHIAAGWVDGGASAVMTALPVETALYGATRALSASLTAAVSRSMAVAEGVSGEVGAGSDARPTFPPPGGSRWR
ncbi:MAG: hypothetical protein QN198_05165 [Armatimonadota bacterium]|nr:hypothetical protein [Armatimonadota bacterium]MDR5702975.1 hypothetical protein [Armatimonadota bacterium]MDR7435791.1 hypothetical protein [Armatimonadota bacterium]